ncbi:hypothetical protein U717_04880 [Rhodobacter capsulatus R121]|nr:hypothetical protein U714_04875 [Rhodobacter capsulatus DE442]ETD79074.1 hypothetical protein U717_04880 [Rhodobacter capsulatus R121]ETE54781.1 hypothetical protein U715_04870 [Rhodobacter capsulatus Y262]
MELLCFRDVPVMPVTRMREHVPLGGPVWPEFERQTAARFCYSGRPADSAPPLRKPVRQFRRPALWGGYLSHEFGHLVAEHITRLLPAVSQRDTDVVLFTLPTGTPPEALAPWVHQVFDWLTMPARRARFVTEPSLAPELRVCAQGEMLGGTAPDPAYLDLLDALPARHGLGSRPRLPLIYVSRAGLVTTGRGGHLGESYLAGLLAQLGVTVIDPGTLPIRAQMQVYARAEALVFAEGSALHGRQLLGRLDQDIHVLRRRTGPDAWTAVLTPRCRSLRSHDVVAAHLTVSGRFRGPEHTTPRELRHLYATFYDLPALFAAFADLGVPLARHWNHDAWRAAVLDDALRWLLAQAAPVTQALPNLIRLIEQISTPDELLDLAEPPPARSASH